MPAGRTENPTSWHVGTLAGFVVCTGFGELFRGHLVAFLAWHGGILAEARVGGKLFFGCGA
jgi:hypothetical protein